ncbi:MAG: hypothetical protein ABI783_06985 [Actinomycetota bacterium]
MLLDYDLLRDARVRPLAALNDSKQVSREGREVLFEAVLAAASGVSVRIVPSSEIDRSMRLGSRVVEASEHEEVLGELLQSCDVTEGVAGHVLP